MNVLMPKWNGLLQAPIVWISVVQNIPWWRKCSIICPVQSECSLTTCGHRAYEMDLGARIVFLILIDLNSHLWLLYWPARSRWRAWQQKYYKSAKDGTDPNVCYRDSELMGPATFMPYWLRFTGWIQRSKGLTSFISQRDPCWNKYTIQDPTVRDSDKQEPPGRKCLGWCGDSKLYLWWAMRG